MDALITLIGLVLTLLPHEERQIVIRHLRALRIDRLLDVEDDLGEEIVRALDVRDVDVAAVNDRARLPRGIDPANILPHNRRLRPRMNIN